MPRITTITPATAYPLSITEVKEHLKVDGSDEDTLITAYMAAAVDVVEQHTMRQLVVCGKELSKDSWYDEHYCTYDILIQNGPMRKVTGITYVDEDGATQTWATSNYHVDSTGDSRKPRIVLAEDGEFPDLKAHYPSAIKVAYQAGYVTLFDSVDTGTDTITCNGHSYSDGDIVQVSNSGGALPAGLAANTTYYVVNSGTNTLQLSTSSGGSAVTITDTGTGNNYIGVLPASLRAALLLMITKLYEMRTDSVEKLPKSSTALIENFKLR